MSACFSLNPAPAIVVVGFSMPCLALFAYSMLMPVLDLAFFEHGGYVFVSSVLSLVVFEHGGSVFEPWVLVLATFEHGADVTGRGEADVKRRDREGLAAATEPVIVPRTGR